MLSRVPSWILRASASLLLCCVPSTLLNAQAPLPTPQELDQLLAPVALYPDALLAQITTASTNPQEILDVEDWLHQNPGLQGAALTNAAQAQGFDPAFLALVSFPQVLDMMAQNIDDYAAIGEAFEADQGSVMDSVQRLRQQAYAAGALRSNGQQQVLLQPENGRQIIVIQPANPQIVYVPQYDPEVIYGGIGTAALITFGAGISLGVLLGNAHPWGWGGWGWNWGRRTVIYNRSPWAVRYNRYRPPRPVYRPRPINYRNRPGYGGHWNNRPGGSRPQPARPQPGRPQPARPQPGRPQIQPVRPTPRPTPTRPTPTRPTPARPAPRPNNTLRPAPAPNRQGRPAPGQPQNRPAPNQEGARPTPTRPNNSAPGQPQNRPQNRPAPRQRDDTRQ
jgi:Protein of unknown function (DUF3300)